MSRIQLPKIAFITVTILNVFMSLRVVAEDNSLPDSVLTVDKVYYYMFSDTVKAARILEVMRIRRLAPSYELDVAEGDLLYNNGKCRAALAFYERALMSEEVRSDSVEYMEELHRMISCYDCMHDEKNKMYYVEMLLRTAEKCGDLPMQSVALFNMGKTLYYQKDKEKGYDMIEKAITIMEKADYDYKYDNLRYNYNTLFIMQQIDGRYEDALLTLDRLEKVVVASSEGETEIDELAQKELKTLYANRAVLYSKLGRMKEADEEYGKWKATATYFTRDDYLIAPYLSDKGKDDEVIRIYSDRERFLRSQGDTVNYHMRTIKRFLGNAYERKGYYRIAARYYREHSVLTDSLKAREQESAAQELAAAYNSHLKTQRIQKQEAAIKVRNLAIVFSVVFLVLAVVVILRVLYYNRDMSRKNKAMVKTIDELVLYKEELFKRQEENLLLREEIGKLSGADRTDDEPGKSETCQPVANAMKLTDMDRLLFERVSHEIITRRLYISPEFGKKELLKNIHVPANKFSAMFKAFAGCSFTQYMQELRLDHAVRLMREQPLWSLDAIAKESCMSKTMFYDLFQKKYGMKPSKFRESAAFTPPN